MGCSAPRSPRKGAKGPERSERVRRAAAMKWRLTEDGTPIARGLAEAPTG